MESNTELIDTLDKVFGINQQKHMNGNWVVQEDGKSIVCTTSRGVKNFKITQKVYRDRLDRSEANAKLISAAPDLLDATASLMQGLVELVGEKRASKMWAYHDGLKAIKKATE